MALQSKRPSVVTTATAETEYMALGQAAQECVWFSCILDFAVGNDMETTLEFVDNQGSIKWLKMISAGAAPNILISSTT